jgi:hypothetical protein
MRSPRRRFAAPFVLTLTAAAPGCSGSGSGSADPKPPTSDLGRTWYVSGQPGGQCMASETMDCPPRVMCNPPPPITIACPTPAPLEHGQPGVRLGEVAPGSCAILPPGCEQKACAETATVPCPAYPTAAPAPAPTPP